MKKTITIGIVALALFVAGIGSASAYSTYVLRQVPVAYNLQNSIFDANKYIVNRFDDDSTTCYVVYSTYQGIPQGTSISCVKVK